MHQKIHLTCFPALNGDCLLVTYDSHPEKHILIDCGYPDTYNKYLKPELLNIAAKHGRIERLILTHIDSDHILGALHFFRDNHKKFIEIGDTWHNTYRHLPVPDRLNTKQAGNSATSPDPYLVLTNILLRGYRMHGPLTGTSISATQASTIGAHLLKGGYNWNGDFQGKAASTDHRQEVHIDESAKIRLLSPDVNKLRQLRLHWEKELAHAGIEISDKEGRRFDDAFEVMLSWEKEQKFSMERAIAGRTPGIEDLASTDFREDNTTTNGSSIAFILQIGEKKLLFLADAHPGLIKSALDASGEELPIQFQLIKVAHHGSSGNTSPFLLQNIDAPVYLFSTNGQRTGHPDKVAIARIIHRPTNFTRQLYFNYRTPNSEYFDRADWQGRYHYSIHYLDRHPYKLII
jgi:beta-lactamase superfamily II metal-dependent hydrolase